MKRMQGKLFTCILSCVLMVVFSGCSMLRRHDAAIDKTPIPHSSSKTDTLREACIRVCDHDHDMCNAGPASRSQIFDAPQQMLGSGAACDQSMRDCIKNCR
jgi:hypothetical protein